MENFRNKYSQSTAITVRLSERDYAFLQDLANRSQTKLQVYAEELLESLLMDRRNPDNSPNYYQRAVVEAAVCAAGVDCD